MDPPTPGLRILLLAPDCNPDSLSTALVGYSHSEALARRHAVTLAIRPKNEEAVRRRHGPFREVEAIRLPWADRIYAFCFRWIFKSNYRSQALTAFSYFFFLAFEWGTWRRTKERILRGDFDVVLRLMPISSVLSSPFAFFLRKGPIPFVVGPINGGLPWPPGFSQSARQKEWISNLRNLYRFLPFARSTYRNAAAIIAGSSQTFAEFDSYREKMFFVPENGVTRCLEVDARPAMSKLELIFVGGLVPYKGCDLALRAAASLLRNGRAHFSVVGDGPERARLEALTRTLAVEEAVTFCGMLSHDETMAWLARTDVLVFPSIREFGGGVVFEALAMGTVPVVVDFGGPGDIVHPGVGYSLPLTSEEDVERQIERILTDLAEHPEQIARLREEGVRYAKERLTWDAKARCVSEILFWTVGRGPKPHLPAPKDRRIRSSRSQPVQTLAVGSADRVAKVGSSQEG